MSNYTLSISKTPVCPNIQLVDNTVYPSSPDEHSKDYLELYKLTLLDYSDSSETLYTTISTVVGYDVLLPDSILSLDGVNYDLELSDGLYKADIIVLPRATVGKTYVVGDVVTNNGRAYVCTTGGTLAIPDPVGSGLFATTTDDAIASRYKATVYLSSICEVLSGIKTTGLSILDTDCLDCPIVCTNDDVKDYYSTFILIQNADMESPTDTQIASTYYQNKFYENLTQIQSIQGGTDV